MEPEGSVDTANSSFLPVLERARSAIAHYVRGSVAHPVDGIFIVPLNCRRTWMQIALEKRYATAGRRLSGLRPDSVRDCANVGWINYMLEDCEKSKVHGFLDCIMI